MYLNRLIFDYKNLVIKNNKAEIYLKKYFFNLKYITPMSRIANKSPVKPTKQVSPVKQAKVPTPAKKTRKPKATTAKPVEKKERKVKRVSNAPKRPSTAYILFMKDNRDRIKAAHPGIAFGDIAKVGAEEWRNAKPAIKQKYEASAEKDRVRYANEMKTYVPDPADKKARKKKKDPNAPKRPMSAYMWYVKDNQDSYRKGHPSLGMTEVMRQLGAQWKALPDNKKKPYQDKYLKDKVRYENEIKM